MFIDILPNLLGPVLVLATLYIPTAVVFEATLSFLGIGIPAPAPSWGNILAEAQTYYQIAWWYVVFPAAALLITTLAFNLLGDGIRDAMDPRTERIFAGGKAAAQRASAQRQLASDRPTAGDRRAATRQRGGLSHGHAALPDPPDPDRHPGALGRRHRHVLPVLQAVPEAVVAQSLAGRAATPADHRRGDQVLRAEQADRGSVLALP